MVYILWYQVPVLVGRHSLVLFVNACSLTLTHTHAHTHTRTRAHTHTHTHTHTNFQVYSSAPPVGTGGAYVYLQGSDKIASNTGEIRSDEDSEWTLYRTSADT